MQILNKRYAIMLWKLIFLFQTRLHLYWMKEGQKDNVLHLSCIINKYCIRCMESTFLWVNEGVWWTVILFYVSSPSLSLFIFLQFPSSSSTYSKLDNLAYSKLEIQQYLTSDQKSVSEKRVLFRCRVRMERFGENFRGGKGPVMSPLFNQHLWQPSPGIPMSWNQKRNWNKGVHRRYLQAWNETRNHQNHDKNTGIKKK